MVRLAKIAGLIVVLRLDQHVNSLAEHAQWQYDSTLPEENIYYWYEGKSSDYAKPDDGYLNNGSSGWKPRFWEEQVGQLFISSAAEFVEERDFEQSSSTR